MNRSQAAIRRAVQQRHWWHGVQAGSSSATAVQLLQGVYAAPHSCLSNMTAAGLQQQCPHADMPPAALVRTRAQSNLGHSARSPTQSSSRHPLDLLDGALSHMDASSCFQAALAPGVPAVKAHKGSAALLLKAHAAAVQPLCKSPVLLQCIVPAGSRAEEEINCVAATYAAGR